MRVFMGRRAKGINMIMFLWGANEHLGARGGAEARKSARRQQNRALDGCAGDRVCEALSLKLSALSQSECGRSAACRIGEEWGMMVPVAQGSCAQ
jgi:hypothetical protein